MRFHKKRPQLTISGERGRLLWQWQNICLSEIKIISSRQGVYFLLTGSVFYRWRGDTSPPVNPLCLRDTSLAHTVNELCWKTSKTRIYYRQVRDKAFCNQGALNAFPCDIWIQDSVSSLYARGRSIDFLIKALDIHIKT